MNAYVIYFTLGCGAALVAFGPYFMRRNERPSDSSEGRGFLGGLWTSFSRGELVWSVALPVGWVLLYYAFVAHVWLSLGRWPAFGERLGGWLIIWHEEAVRYLITALLASLYVVPFVFVPCLFLSRWRHITICILCYAAAVGLAYGALYLAPHEFLNWLFD